MLTSYDVRLCILSCRSTLCHGTVAKAQATDESEDEINKYRMLAEQNFTGISYSSDSTLMAAWSCLYVVVSSVSLQLNAVCICRMYVHLIMVDAGAQINISDNSRATMQV